MHTLTTEKSTIYMCITATWNNKSVLQEH